MHAALATDWDRWTAIGTLALAGATFLVILVALFEEPLRRYFSRATLYLTIGKDPPETLQIALTNPQTGAFVCWTIFVRVRVVHRRGRAGENAEIIASRLWRIDSHGGRELVDTFIPMSLLWSNFQPPTIIARVPRSGFRHCDLGAFYPSDVFGYEPPVSGETRLRIVTMVQPNPVAGGEFPNVLSPGAYEIELQLTGDNVRPLTERWVISFGTAWSDDAERVLGGVRIQKAS